MDKTSSRDDASEDAPSFQHKIRIKGPTKKRFETIFSLGKKAKGDVARIIAYPGTGLIGIAVSKKIGSHPRRNKLKRRFRDAIFHRRDLPSREFDFVVIVNAVAASVTFERIEEDGRTLFDKIVERWAAESESS